MSSCSPSGGPSSSSRLHPERDGGGTEVKGTDGLARVWRATASQKPHASPSAAVSPPPACPTRPAASCTSPAASSARRPPARRRRPPGPPRRRLSWSSWPRSATLLLWWPPRRSAQRGRGGKACVRARTAPTGGLAPPVLNKGSLVWNHPDPNTHTLASFTRFLKRLMWTMTQG